MHVLLVRDRFTQPCRFIQTKKLYTLVMDCLFISQKETDLFIVVWKWFI